MFPDNRGSARAAYADLVRKIDEEGLEIKLSLGAEYYFGSDLVEDFAGGNVIRLGEKNRYFLVEFKTFAVQEYFKDLFFRMNVNGLIPVLAHPERNDLHSSVSRDIFHYLIQNGALVQCDLSSLLGKWGRHAEDNTRRFIEDGMVAAFASDLHCSREEIDALPAAIEALRKLAGTEVADRLLGENPRDILAGRRPKWNRDDY
jgi:protein-tyrosine phosphatase